MLYYSPDSGKMQEPLPAVFLLGPPHSGKSVLAYHLSQALRRRGVLHYLLRAAPDGEGDWFAEGPRGVVRTLRMKRDYTPAFVAQMAQHIRQRQVPLLVDAGGRPTPEQVEAIFAQATHGILLLRDDSQRQGWEDLIARCRIPLLADLTSRLEGPAVLYSAAGETPLRGVLVGLERGASAVGGPVFEALVESLARLFGKFQEGLQAEHSRRAPQGARLLDAISLLGRIRPGAERWRPEDLASLSAVLPRRQPLALYGRAPVWVVAAMAVAAWPQPFYLFDVRYGWVQSAQIVPADAGQRPLVTVRRQKARTGWVRLVFRLDRAEIPYMPQVAMGLPPLAASEGVILDGKLPFWLMAGLARFYAGRGARVAVFQPAINAAVCVTCGRASAWRV